MAVNVKLEHFDVDILGTSMTVFVQEGNAAALQEALKSLALRVQMGESRPSPSQTSDGGKTLKRVLWGDRQYDCTPVVPAKLVEVPMPKTETKTKRKKKAKAKKPR